MSKSQIALVNLVTSAMTPPMARRPRRVAWAWVMIGAVVVALVLLRAAGAL